ncbi:VacJ family lipoprotein [Salipiger sp. P9]|uniref:MlaA family lipoprotein n=1 Tax=Salipiger pentaromativorans TaxID=2943193 RepID=UPI0021575F5D|nr:VacJ family lipoprotein [Salipiger pentaromativorans]MCR8548362.1 VacJ family lipoprotein [Salipiger pentaromativorans]
MAGLAVSACAVPGPGEAPDGIYDPNEGANRRVHAFNKRIDSALSGGEGPGLAASVPEPLAEGVANFADTVSLPQTVMNQILQARLGRAARNTLRFSVNATVGIAGLFDVASQIGLPEDESDFGETLYVWGLPEGAYIELPVLGPATERDAVGKVVDLFTDPVSYLVPTPDRYYATGAKLADKALSRARYGETVDSVLYDSADSYAQLRMIYLQKRRFELGDESAGEEDYIDPEALDTEGF